MGNCRVIDRLHIAVGVPELVGNLKVLQYLRRRTDLAVAVLDHLVDQALARQAQHVPRGQRKLDLGAPRLLMAHQQRRIRRLKLPGNTE